MQQTLSSIKGTLFLEIYVAYYNVYSEDLVLSLMYDDVLIITPCSFLSQTAGK
jgi:hypothetical protein